MRKIEKISLEEYKKLGYEEEYYKKMVQCT